MDKNCAGCGKKYDKENILASDTHCFPCEYLLSKRVQEKDLAKEQVAQAQEIEDMALMHDIGKLLTEIHFFEMWRMEKEKLCQRSRMAIGATSFHMGATHALAYIVPAMKDGRKALKRLKSELEGEEDENT